MFARQDVPNLQNQLLGLLHQHPVTNWSVPLLAAVVAAITLEVASQDASDDVSNGPGLRLI